MSATLELILLALATAVRPTSLAAVYAILSRAAPRRLMAAYTITGIVFTIALGLIVIWAFNGIEPASGSRRPFAILLIISGVLLIGLSVGLHTGRLGVMPDSARAGGRFERTNAVLDRRITMRTAALAGPATHVPGLFYLFALNLIVADDPSVGQTLFDVLTYNVVWFALPIGATVVCIVRPETAREGVAAIAGWTTDHSRPIMVGVTFVLGVALVVRGLLDL